MITFKQELTVSEELVQGLAYELGWTDSIQVQEVGTPFETSQENPESYTEFVQRKAREHMIEFFLPFGEKLVTQEIINQGIEEQMKQAKAQIEAQIVAPIIEGLITEVVVDKEPLPIEKEVV
jgi:hypothetical protein